MKHLFFKRKYIKSLENEIEKLKDELEFFKASEDEYKKEAESLKDTLTAIENGDCAPGAYCEHCDFGGKVEHRLLWSTQYDYVCLKNVACKQFDKRVAPAPVEGADKND